MIPTIRNSLTVALLLCGSVAFSQETLTPIPVIEPKAVITAPVDAVMAGDELLLDFRASTGDKPRWKWFPEKLPGKCQPRVEQDGRLRIFTYPGPLYVRLTVQNEEGSDDTDVTLYVLPYVPPFSPVPTPIPGPVPPGPVPVPVPPPTPADQFTADVIAGFGPAGKADAKRWAALWRTLGDTVASDQSLTNTLAVYTAGLSAERKLGIDRKAYPKVAGLIQKQMAPFETIADLTPDLRKQIADTCQKIAAACQAAAGGTSSAR